jgi:hypothetical protein
MKATNDRSSNETSLLNILNLLINFKAAVISGILYFFVMEMQPVRIILRSLTFEEYARRMKQQKLQLIVLMFALVISEGAMEYFVWYEDTIQQG